MPSAKIQCITGSVGPTLGFVLQNRSRLGAQLLCPTQGVVGTVAENGFVLQNSPNPRLSYGGTKPTQKYLASDASTHCITPVPVSYWRSVSHSHNVFFFEN
jgi:hypothetical protein